MKADDGKSNLSLIPRPPSAVEKTEPGAKRVLAGMIADTLALANKAPTKPIFTVVIGDCEDGAMFTRVPAIISPKLDQRYDLRFIHVRTEAELLEVVHNRSFDLIFVYLFPIFWRGNLEDMVTRAVEVLGRLRRQYGKTIIATQGMDLSERFKQVGVVFLGGPIKVEAFWDLLERELVL